jgi:peptidoglycan/LPS O-acetylase OafA/YrhL
MTELRALTSVRGLAAWLVVLYHIRGGIAGLPPAVEAMFAKGYLAVDFFFLLSGFVIWLTWHDRLNTPGAIPRFLQKRIARIWPLHAVMLAFAVALALLLRATGRDDPAFPVAELPLHILLVQNWGFTAILHWNDPAWSISCELAAYLLFPLLVLVVNWRKRSIVALMGIAAVLLTTLHVVMNGANSLGDDIPRFGLIRCLTEFVTGSIVAAVFLRMQEPDAQRHDARPHALVSAQQHMPLAAALFATGSLASAWALGVPETLVAPATFAMLLLALALTAGRSHHPLEGRVIHYLGEISYATYLSHFLIWKAFKLPLASDTLSPVLITCYLTLVLAASIILYHGVERPAQRWINARPIHRRRVMPTG